MRQRATGGTESYKPVRIPTALRVINGSLAACKETSEMEGISTSAIVENNLIERIDYIQLSVTDLGASREWYAKHFGFKEDYNDGKMCVMMPPQPIPSGLPTLILLNSGRQNNWILQEANKQGMIGLHCKDMAALRTYLSEQGIEVTDINDGGFAYFMSFFDPDGNMFEAIQLKKDE